MGLYLSKPDVMKVTDYQELNHFKFAYCSTQGWKIKQDDYLLVSPNFDKDNSLFAIFEVHGSPAFGYYLKQNFIQTLMSTVDYKNENYEKALINTFDQIDKYLSSIQGQAILKGYDEQETVGAYGGCTALVVLLTKEELFVANAGVNHTKHNNKISRCVIQYQGRHKAMSKDHYPIDDLEKQRIIAAGGEIWENRVNVHLPFSRSLGDYEYKSNTLLDSTKQLIISQPDIKSVDSQECDMILLGSHGFWQTWTNSGITDVIMERVQGGKPLLRILEDIVDSCIATSVESEYGLDNLSCILVIMNKHA